MDSWPETWSNSWQPAPLVHHAFCCWIRFELAAGRHSSVVWWSTCEVVSHCFPASPIHLFLLNYFWASSESHFGDVNAVGVLPCFQDEFWESLFNFSGDIDASRLNNTENEEGRTDVLEREMKSRLENYLEIQFKVKYHVSCCRRGIKLTLCLLFDFDRLELLELSVYFCFSMWSLRAMNSLKMAKNTRKLWRNVSSGSRGCLWSTTGSKNDSSLCSLLK